MKFLFRAVLVLACLAPAYADKVVLKDGKVYDGIVIEQTDTAIKIRTAKAVYTFPMDRVASVEKGESQLALRDRYYDALDGVTAQAYVDAARWLAGAGHEFYDEKMFRRLLEIATFLDARSGYEAQKMLAKHFQELGETRLTVIAWRRALRAKPGDEETLRALEPLEQDLTQASKATAKDLCGALDQILCDILEDAAPRLAKIDAKLLPEHALRALDMPFDKFRADILARVPCKSCRGARKLPCPDCDGKGEIICKKCNGKCRRPEWQERADANEHFAEAVCPACHGVGSFSCAKCDAKRPISIQFQVVGSSCHAPIEVTPVPGKDTDALEAVINLKTYKSKDGSPVGALVPCKPISGGEITCPTCQGALFAPPMTAINKETVKECLEDLQDYALGRKTWTPIDEAALDRYDTEEVADRLFKFKNGKWTK